MPCRRQSLKQKAGMEFQVSSNLYQEIPVETLNEKERKIYMKWLREGKPRDQQYLPWVAMSPGMSLKMNEGNK